MSKINKIPYKKKGDPINDECGVIFVDTGMTVGDLEIVYRKVNGSKGRNDLEYLNDIHKNP